jgi:hypothetical protein
MGHYKKKDNQRRWVNRRHISTIATQQMASTHVAAIKNWSAKTSTVKNNTACKIQSIMAFGRYISKVSI